MPRREVGIAISTEYRDIGIGTEMLRTLLRQSVDSGLTMLSLHVFATNHRTLHVYEKVGFTKTRVRPKMYLRNGRYIDDILMTMELAAAHGAHREMADVAARPVAEGKR